MTALSAKAEPCLTCPYRKDVPSGVWSYDEYEKLRDYDDNTAYATFLCHQSRVAGHDIVCKGWCMVHRESAGVRLALIHEKIDLETAFTEVKCKLHESGNAAADFGQSEIESPGRRALKMVDKLLDTGGFKI